MQISSNNAILTNYAPRTTPKPDLHRENRAHDSYTRNAASATVIDAEYIEPQHVVPSVPPEHKGIGNTISAERIEMGRRTTKTTAQEALSSRFKTADSDSPPPGSYINLYA